MKYYVVKYEGWRAFIKPFSAVKDGRIYSQRALTPSIITGIERNLLGTTNSEPAFVERHKLSHLGFSLSQEETRNPMNPNKKGVVERGYLVYPKLYLAFNHEKASDIASRKGLRLTGKVSCLMLPNSMGVFECEADEFDELDGYEFIPDDGSGDPEDLHFMGGNTFKDNEGMWGEFAGFPVRNMDDELS